MADGADFSTEQLAPGERFDTWRQLGLETVGIAVAKKADGEGASFRASVRTQRRGGLFRFVAQSDAARSSRGRDEISRHPMDCYCVYRELAGGAHYDFAGRELTTRRGSILIVDLDQPFVTQPVSGAGFRHGVLLLPKPMLDPHLPAQTGAFSRPLPEGPGLGGLAASALESLWREWDDIPEASMSLAADTLCRLVGLAFGAAAGDHAVAIRRGRLARARRYIDSHLTDPELSLARAAAALRISERTLYASFEIEGTTFAAHVRRRRLEECRDALVACPSRPVMDVALSWGFGSMPTFYRAFQAAFGLSPGELREAAAKASAIR